MKNHTYLIHLLYIFFRAIEKWGSKEAVEKEKLRLEKETERQRKSISTVHQFPCLTSIVFEIFIKL